MTTIAHCDDNGMQKRDGHRSAHQMNLMMPMPRMPACVLASKGARGGAPGGRNGVIKNAQTHCAVGVMVFFQ
jgi:hypothetical protein